MSVSNEFCRKLSPLSLPVRYLMGPGPSSIHPRVLQAMALTECGFMDPNMLSLNDDVCDMLRYVFQTKNAFTIPMTCAGTGAMESCLINFVEPGSTVLVCVAGFFSQRIADMAERMTGVKVVQFKKDWSHQFTADEVEAAVKEHQPSLVAMVHGETSTGCVQKSLKEIAAKVHENGALLLVDTVASLGGVPFFADEWDIDLVYTGGQKCLSAPPGIAAVTVSPRAWKWLVNRKTPCASWYFDFKQLAAYWGVDQETGDKKATKPKSYVHTPPINMLFALREALAMICEEGLDNVWARHKSNAEYLWQLLDSELSLKPYQSDENIRCHTVTTVTVPEKADAKAVCVYVRDNFNLEILPGLGPFATKFWRIGCMGQNARKESILQTVSAMKQAFKALGYN